MAGVEVQMYVRMFGIPMNCSEGDRLGKGLGKEVIGKISDLLIGRRYIKREDYPVVSSTSFPSLVVFQSTEIGP